jgi:FixJ family two-component response regulator
MNRPVTFGFSDATALGQNAVNADEDPALVLEQAEVVEQLKRWLDKRSEKEKIVLRTLTSDYSLSQAGHDLNVDPSTVWRQREKLMTLARRELQEIDL